MSQIKEINDQILEKILKTDEFYEALWGKEEFIPEQTITTPNDFNCGAISNQLEYFYAYIRQITGKSLSNLSDPYIDMIVYFFTRIQRLPGEADLDLIRRMESLIIRECTWRSERFGTPWDILNVFCYYIDRSLLYYVPNAVITDLLINGDFEDPIGVEWVFSPSGDRSAGDSFCGSYKADFGGFDSLSQTIAVTSGAYILNSFIKPISGPPTGFSALWNSGDGFFENAAYIEQDAMFSTGSGKPLSESEFDVFNLIIQRDSDSKYFNTTTLTWETVSPDNKFSTIGNDWVLSEFFILVDGSYNITITYSKKFDFFMDHVEFGEKLYPAFEILFIDSGLATGFSSTWVSGQLSYDKASYLDQAALFSSASSNYSDTYYQDLLNTIKASGVKGIFTREVRT